MTGFERLTAIAAPLPLANVDTDKILPAAFLKTVKRIGLGTALFAPLRRRADGSDDPGFILNRAPWTSARILVARDNFGCGSSREHAPWALLDFGIAAIIAPGFADIFQQNCIKNGIVPAVVAADQVERLLVLVADPVTATISVDLHAMTIVDTTGVTVPFAIDAAARAALLSGEDEITRSLTFRDTIVAHRARRAEREPWLVGITPDRFGP